MILLQVSGLAKSVYYYTLSKIDKDDKNKEIIDKIKEIFINNKERYGYRRITLELRNQGYNVNHKKVYRLMVKLGLKPLKRNKRKYSSYKGTIGKIADNLIERDFNAEKPNQKWYTDVTEFNRRGEKCYLSPILDGYNGEIISYNTSKTPNLEQINEYLIANNCINHRAFAEHPRIDGCRVDLSIVNQECIKNPYKIEFKYQFSGDNNNMLNYWKVIKKDFELRSSDLFILIISN